MPARPRADQIRDAVKLYNANWSIDDIALELEVEDDTVDGYLRDGGVTRRNTAGPGDAVERTLAANGHQPSDIDLDYEEPRPADHTDDTDDEPEEEYFIRGIGSLGPQQTLPENTAGTFPFSTPARALAEHHVPGIGRPLQEDDCFDFGHPSGVHSTVVQAFGYEGEAFALLSTIDDEVEHRHWISACAQFPDDEDNWLVSEHPPGLWEDGGTDTSRHAEGLSTRFEVSWDGRLRTYDTARSAMDVLWPVDEYGGPPEVGRTYQMPHREPLLGAGDSYEPVQCTVLQVWEAPGRATILTSRYVATNTGTVAEERVWRSCGVADPAADDHKSRRHPSLLKGAPFPELPLWRDGGTDTERPVQLPNEAPVRDAAAALAAAQSALNQATKESMLAEEQYWGARRSGYETAGSKQHVDSEQHHVHEAHRAVTAALAEVVAVSDITPEPVA